MTNKDISESLRIEAEKALQGFRDGTLNFADYPCGSEIPYLLEFSEWIGYLEDYLDVDSIELQDENRLKTIKRFFPTTDYSRLLQLIANPESITDDESLEWRRSLYKDQDGSNLLLLVAIETSSGETGVAIICSYSDIPGGEHDLVEIFSSVEEGEQYLSKHCF